jgi:hypothetical protein
MRVVRPVLLGVFLCVSFTAFLPAQNVTTSSNQAFTTLQAALTALGGGSTVNDITLTGTAQRIVGSDDETGTAAYRALPSANRLDIVFSGGTSSEIRSIGTRGPAGSWVGLDGVSHKMAFHNLVVDGGWFPLFTLENINSSTSSLLKFVGQETRNGESVIHLSASQQFQASPGVDTALMQHLSEVDIYLDSKTLLPAAYVINVHPDLNELLDIPMEIRYSNYQKIGGGEIPFHVQRLVNNTLTLDLQFQNASLNTGLTTAQINAQ